MDDIKTMLEEAEELEPEDGVFLQDISKVEKEDDHSNDAMVAFMLDDSQQADMARVMQDVGITDGIQNGQFHITLKYLGDISKLDKEAIILKLRLLSHQPPVTVSIGNVGMFDQTDKRGVYHLEIDSHEIELFRRRVVAVLRVFNEIPEDTHPRYRPHITLVMDGDSDIEYDKFRPYVEMSLTFDKFHLVFGNERIAIPLGQDRRITMKEVNRGIVKFISKRRGEDDAKKI